MGRNKKYILSAFFRRGKLNEKITESKILIIGIGAIGSIVATTLVRGGCTNICIFDHDIKEPENVCRSEYLFSTGISSKINDLGNVLANISPFVNVKVSDSLIDFTKFAINNPDSQKIIEYSFKDYDIIFDCTTDNDLAYIFDQLNIKADIFNLSITNHAKNLVCVTKPNLYKWMCDIFNIIGNDSVDLYNPTGCWSPTFKASYNDINTLVQYAIKQINLSYEKQVPIRNFYLTASFDETFNIKLCQF